MVTGETSDVSGDAPCQIVIDCNDNPIIITPSQPSCDPIAGTFTVAVTISGGDGGPYAIDGTLFGTNTDIVGNPFTIGPIPDGQSYDVIATDGQNCSNTYNSGEVVCSKCPEDMVGNMPFDAIFVCGNDATSISVSGYAASDTSFITYVLHSGNPLTEDNVIASNPAGSFTGSGAIATNVGYFISAVVGVNDEDGNGIPDLTNECTIVSANSTSVTFLDPISITVGDIECDEDAAEGNYSVTITGGLPAANPSASYSVTGTMSNNATFNNPFVLGPLNDGTPWVLNVVDAIGCSASENGDVNCEKPTPVEWLAFSGEVVDAGNQLVWVTATEIDNDYFTLESSRDGINFTTVETITGAGTSYVSNTYEHLDKDALAGVTFYRVVQHDYNGQTNSTNVISLTRGETTFGIDNISPVPATSVLNVVATFVKANTQASITITDIAGRLIDTSNYNSNEGVNVITLDVSNYATGMYFLTISDGANTATAKFVK